MFIWYAIITILFRCPATLEECDENSKHICKPYFQLKHAVAPHVEPYYDTYAAPYVELVQPYYEVLDRSVITPGRGIAIKYGAPRIAQAQAYGTAQWEKNARPQLEKYQALAKSQYDEHLAPHVQQLSNTVSPYYDIARTNALQTYHEILLPSYLFVLPYAEQGFHAASDFTTDTAVPAAIWAWNKTYIFLDGTIWPQMRVLYIETVEPQLVRIGQRLGRHNEKAATTQKLVTTPKSVITEEEPTEAEPILRYEYMMDFSKEGLG
jgi:hypothetical protein